VAGIGGDNGSPAARLRTRERERQISELRLRSATYLDIAQQLQMSVQGVLKAYMRALRRIPEKEALACRKEALERLDRLRVRVWNRLGALPTADPGVDFAVQSALRVEQREAKLLELDALDEKRQLLALITKASRTDDGSSEQ
jgi:DNA-binding CsgD family transcriptional regulator